MKRLVHTLVFGACLGVSTALWADTFKVQDIKLEGLQRLAPGNVFSAMGISIGDTIDDSRVASAIRSLFATGNYQDVDISRQNNVLFVSVKERPAISLLDIEGNKVLKTDALKDGLKKQGLAEGEIFQRATLDRIQAELERQYLAQGRYGAKVTASVEDAPNNRVKINIKIKEGSVSKISHINIVGNKHFSKDELFKQFQLSTSNWLSFFTDDDKYSREKLSGDLERLRSYYQDRGFVNFNIESTQVSISPDKKSVFITINVSEGEQYNIGKVSLEGDLSLGQAELEQQVEVKSGELFSRKTITEDVDRLKGRLGHDGFAFANVNPVPVVHDDSKTVDVTYFIDPQTRTYVRRINFTGNTVTADEVLRREMRQMEAAPVNTDLVDKSKKRLERLGYFSEVNLDMAPVPNTSDQVDLNYSVVEQASGSLSASVGFAQGEGLIFGFDVSQKNFLGSGNQVSFSLTRSSVRTDYSIDYLDPYYTVDGVSRGFSVYYRKTDYDQEDVSDYQMSKIGANMTLGYPLDEDSNISGTIGYEKVGIDLGSSPIREIIKYVDNYGDSYNEFLGSVAWNRNRLNNTLMPTDGTYQRAGLDVALPGSTLDYYKLGYKGDIYWPIGQKGYAVHLGTNLGYGDGYGGETKLPFYENYYLGGISSLRGFKTGSVGPKGTPCIEGTDSPCDGSDTSSNAVGGNVKVAGTAEFIFPVPYFEDKSSIRSLFFLDAGNVYDTKCDRSIDSSCSRNIDLGDIRYSTGVGVVWLTRFAPLSFVIAQPLNAQDGDRKQSFQFSLGQTF
ncbi:outer membrane protein assembly factor BamA [Pokkaliibacter sp. MBI-7]|uniref:outer membrane protein assembly factor BamA n=1 Tax=Pokkaliibacter sp. MBI-7 TaxID=3040600 RepID=UPI0024477D0E|nr:outer membrane protein assembly factor BamA [Pokkaliibacter sp. MBI-7]MDH2434564.1 outer membrane protein assembly factor BamA [Pokkaliibacter sp. MBI-7]